MSWTTIFTILFTLTLISGWAVIVTGDPDFLIPLFLSVATTLYVIKKVNEED